MVFKEVLDVMWPGRARRFFRAVRPRSVEDNLDYLLILGLFTLAGTFIAYGVTGITFTVSYGPASASTTFIYPLESAAIIALEMYMTAIISALFGGIAFAFSSKWLLGRRAGVEEGITLISYVYTPVLLLGILAPINFMGFTVVIPVILPITSMIAYAYAFFILSSAIKATFEPPRSMWVTLAALWILVILLAPAITGLVLSPVFDSLLPSVAMETGPEFTYKVDGRSVTIGRGFMAD